MDKFIVEGGEKLTGEIRILGSKNMALKAVVAACLTEDEVIINNVPLISDLTIMLNIIKELGGETQVNGHSLKVKFKEFKTSRIEDKEAASIRTSAMFIAPLLSRMQRAEIPSPGGDKVGSRPIDRIIHGVEAMGGNVRLEGSHYIFEAPNGLRNTIYKFPKNTHMGTETLILCSVLIPGVTILENAAEEPEVDSLMELLNSMGAKVIRKDKRTIEITGVERLHGAVFEIPNDRNEAVTFAVAAILTEGDVSVMGIKALDIAPFLNKVKEIGGGIEEIGGGIRFFYKGKLKSCNVATSIYPGFMTDWQAPWAVLMTKASGISSIHETIYENRFAYVSELIKMGAKIEFFNPEVSDLDSTYNFNLEDNKPEYSHAIKIYGPTPLHGATLSIADLRAGATLVLAALSATGTSFISGVSHIDRGYEKFEERLNSLGAKIKRVKE